MTAEKKTEAKPTELSEQDMNKVAGGAKKDAGSSKKDATPTPAP